MEGRRLQAGRWIASTRPTPARPRRAAIGFWSALPQITYTQRSWVQWSTAAINIRDSPRQVILGDQRPGGIPSGICIVLEDTPFDST